MKLILHCSLLLGAALTGCIAAVDGHTEVVELNNILNYNLFTVFSKLNIHATEFEKLLEAYDAAVIAFEEANQVNADPTVAESSATGDSGAKEDNQAATEFQEENMYDFEFATKGKPGNQESSVKSVLDETIPKEVGPGQGATNTHRGEDMEDGRATNGNGEAKPDNYDVASDEVTRAKTDAETDNSTPDESLAETVFIAAEALKDDEEILNEDIRSNDSEDEESDHEKVHDTQTGGEVEGGTANSAKGKVPVQHKDDAAASTNENSKYTQEIELTELADTGVTSNDGRETNKERNDKPLENNKTAKVHSNSETVIAADGRTGESAATGRESEGSIAKHVKMSGKKKAAEKAVKAEAERAFTEKTSEAAAEKDATKKAAEAAAERAAADKAAKDEVEKAAANKSLEVTEAGSGGLDDDVKDIVYTDSANFNKPALAVGILAVLFAVVFC